MKILFILIINNFKLINQIKLDFTVSFYFYNRDNFREDKFYDFAK